MVCRRSRPRRPRAEKDITTLLRERHHLARGDDDDFQIRNLSEIATLSSKGPTR